MWSKTNVNTKNATGQMSGYPGHNVSEVSKVKGKIVEFYAYDIHCCSACYIYSVAISTGSH